MCVQWGENKEKRKKGGNGESAHHFNKIKTWRRGMTKKGKGEVPPLISDLQKEGEETERTISTPISE